MNPVISAIKDKVSQIVKDKVKNPGVSNFLGKALDTAHDVIQNQIKPSNITDKMSPDDEGAPIMTYNKIGGWNKFKNGLAKIGRPLVDWGS